MLVRYKVGDIVEGLNFTGHYSILNGKTGVVKYFELTPGSSWVCVEWSIVFEFGHSGDGRGKEGRCRNFIGMEDNPIETAARERINSSITQIKLVGKRQLEFEF